MGNVLNLLLQALIRYIASNPGALDALVAEIVTAATTALKTHNATAPKPATPGA